MAISLSRISLWWWGEKENEPISNAPSMNSLPDWGFGLREQDDNLKFRSVKAAKMASSSRKVKRKWKSRVERRTIDKEYDVVLVPSDGVSLSGSESDDSDWSIGWLEPHAPDFLSDDEFAVLVPCYRHNDSMDLKDLSNDNSFLSAIKNLPVDSSSAEGKKYMEQWLSSLHNL